MNTEQNYSGEGAFHSPTPPAAQIAAQLTAEQDERRAYFRRLAELPGATEYLENLLDLVDDFAEGYDPLPALAELTAHWLRQPWVSQNPDAQRKASRMLELMQLLGELRMQYGGFKAEAEPLNQPLAQEGNGHE